jgi:AAA+ superfamily predicted ATPase
LSNQIPNPFPGGTPQTAQKSGAAGGVRTGVTAADGRPPDKKDELRLLVNSHHPLITIESAEEERVEALLHDVAVELGVAFYVWTVTTGLARYGGQPLYNSGEPELALANIAQVKGDALFLLKDFSRYTEQDKICRKLRDLAEGFRSARRSIVISGASLRLPAELAADAVPYHMMLPDLEELLPAVREVLAAAAREQNLAVHLDSQAVAQLTRSLVGLPQEEALRTLRMCLLSRGQADPGLLTDVLEAKRKALREDGLLETVRRDSSFGDVAGLARLREWVRKRGSALTPEGRAFGLEAPKGVLITGVQGCGKSLAARAIAGEWGYELARLDAGTLYDKYIGESEKRLHQTLELAQRLAPMVLWIDEIEKAFASSSAGTESDGGLSQRLLATMLTWMQEREGGVFLAATSNNISSLPPEMLRKGRFDEIFFVDLPGEPAREALFGLHLKKRGRDATKFDLAKLAAASEGFSGAEIEQSIVAGLYTAFSGKQQLSTEILLAELRGTQPLSVTRAEEVSSLRAWAQSRAVPAE